jgi:hypothetical protein
MMMIMMITMVMVMVMVVVTIITKDGASTSIDKNLPFIFGTW